MQILFIVSGTYTRKYPWNGHLARYGGVGVSGTDQSAILYAEHLAWNGHNVHLICESAWCGTMYNGVFYGNQYPSDPSQYDAIVATSYPLPIPPNLTFVNAQHLILYCQTPHIPSENELCLFCTKHPGCAIQAVHVSEWSRAATMRNSPHYEVFVKNDVMIPNPLMMDVIDNVPIIKQPRTIGFHARWERGGDVVQRVFDRLGWERQWGKLLASDYDAHSKILTTQKSWLSEEKMVSIDKLEVSKLISRADYFVYPIICNSCDIVQKDAFPCCIAEALALGAIVITWSLGAIPEVFGDYVQYAELPAGFDTEDLNTCQQDATLRSEEAVSNIVRVIQYFEDHPEEKEAVRKAGIHYARNQFNPANWIQTWESLFWLKE